MSIRIIRDSESLDSAWEELVFTESRLVTDVNAEPFAVNISGLISRVEQVRSGQFGTWREEVAAQAAVAAIDDRLDDWVRLFDYTLRVVLSNDVESPRYRRYFSVAPQQFFRMGLERELGRSRSWIDSLATEPEEGLRALGLQLKHLVADGDAALERRRRAAGTRADHRVREITSLVDDINAARASLYGALIQRATELQLPRDWPDRFFRHNVRTQAPTAHPGPATLPPQLKTPTPSSL